jgi:hypothetical protein
MKSLSSGIDPELCSGFFASDWIELAPELDTNEAAWEKAIVVFESRVRERFLSCIDALCDAERKGDPNRRCVPGFAIVGLCCLLLETLYLFQNGSSARSERNGEVFRKILNWPCFNQTFSEESDSESFYKGIRCGILHNAETRHWVVRTGDPKGKIAERRDSVYVLNRSVFLEVVKAEFENYLQNLRAEGELSNGQLRKNFRENMDVLCLTS